jgi:hypothetical protein
VIWYIRPKVSEEPAASIIMHISVLRSRLPGIRCRVISQIGTSVSEELAVSIPRVEGISFTLKIKTPGSSEKSAAIHETTRRRVPEDSNLNRETITFHVLLLPPAHSLSAFLSISMYFRYRYKEMQFPSQASSHPRTSAPSPATYQLEL